MSRINRTEFLPVARAAALSASIDPEKAIETVRGLVKAAAVEEDLQASISVKLKVGDPGAEDAGVPCLVRLETPFGCICLVPPGGSC